MHTDALITELASQADSQLTMTDALVRGRWNNPVTWRQPTHTVYVPAHLITGTETLGAALPNDWGHRALTALSAYGAGPGGLSGPGVPAGDPLAGARTLTRDLGVPDEDAETVGTLTVEKLRREPIEDLRIDFEDGFTQRGVPASDQQADEDSRAREAASVLSAWFRIQPIQPIQPNQPNKSDQPNQPSDGAPAFAGIRMKSFDPAVRERGIRTLVLVLTGLADNGVLNNLLIQDRRKLRLTLPKVQHHSQVEAFVSILEALEKELGVPPIPFEVQIETPQAIDNIGGTTGGSEAARILAVGQDRILSLHYGTYDYSASLGIDAAEQSLEHPVADHAKNILQVCTSSVGVELSDGSTNRIPVGTPAEIFDAWQLHHRLVTRHLRRGIRQGWDLHPHHLVTRHLATIAYFRANWVTAAARLRAYTANDTSQWMDEPATAKALAGYLLRAHACGAITDTELTSTELTRSDLFSLQVTGRKAS